MAYQRVTLAQLEDRLAERVGGDETFWTEPERRAAINEALSVWQLLTGQFVATTVVTVTSGAENWVEVDTTGTQPPSTFLRVRCENTEDIPV